MTLIIDRFEYEQLGLLPNLGSAESILERKQVSLPPESVFRGALSSAFTYLLSLKHYSCCSIVLHESYLKGTKFQYINRYILTYSYHTATNHSFSLRLENSNLIHT